MQHRLIPHPDFAPRAVLALAVSVTLLPGGRVSLDYRVDGRDALRLPPAAAPTRADELWRTTCFELFFRPAGGEAYREFNFAPSTRWAAYAFDAYRSGMRELPSGDPGIATREEGADFVLSAGASGFDGPGTLALTAVIEERDGTKSYWSLRHPQGKPDFHHPDCFALELPAPDGA